MLIFPCQVCNTQLSAEERQAGTLVRCPTCLSTLKVPQPQTRPAEQLVGAGAGASAAVGAGLSLPRQHLGSMFTNAAGRSSGKRYGFNCPYCSSRLEATEAMAAQDGQCPTCGKTITIPILDRYGRLIDPKTRQIIKQDPHPVHAYAAAGDRAPIILRQPGGAQLIQCPRCESVSPITANNCKACGMPFTMEGTTLEASGASNGFCVASLVLGIIGIPAFCTVVTPLLAIVFGIIGYNQASKADVQTGGKGMAIAGIVCGVIGCIIGALTFLR
jgi:DNA-directed RNA polymerase subunit RPC12/RpoP